jgi:cell division protein FtsB
MDALEILKVGMAIIGSSGLAGMVIFGLSNWLGKLWANRLMENEKAAHQRELEKLRAELQQANEKDVSKLKSELEIYKEKHLKGHEDKITIYRMVADTVAEILGDFDRLSYEQKPLNQNPDGFDKFNRNRMKVYGYISMFAPQEVMDALDQLFDHLLLVAYGREQYEWSGIRSLALNLLNEVRKDIGFNPTPIEYRGNL